MSLFSRLYYSTICRICGVDNSEGINMYDKNNETDFKTVINRYLPIKVDDDGKLPRTICPGCHIHLASTTQFFNLMVKGQARLRHLWSQELEFHNKIKREKVLILSNNKHKKSSAINDPTLNILELPDDTFYVDNHEFSLLVEGLIKPRKKRGRPKKCQSEKEAGLDSSIASCSELEQLPQDHPEQLEKELGKRKRKLPERLKEAVAGNELEKILLEEGAIDEYETDAVQFEKESSREKDVSNELFASTGEVIGHLQTPDGKIAGPILSQSNGRSNNRRKKPRWPCNFCQQTFKDKANWILHKRTHEGLNMQCGDANCWEIFNNKNLFIAHQMAAKHNGLQIVNIEVASNDNVLEIKCDICGFVAESNEMLEKHVESDHTETKGELCEITLQEPAATNPNFQNIQIETFNNVDLSETPSEKLDGDTQSSSMTPSKNTGKFECNICKRSFNHSSSLVYHTESCHNNGIRFACSKCSKSFSHRQLLQRHQMVHSENRPFSCTKCGVGFKSKSNLYNHQVVHTGEKKFSCTLCGQKFSHKTSLTLHGALHQGIRPFKCPECPKSFAQNGNLSDHLRIHNGSKPYTCEHCGRAFTTSSQYKLHVKRHTGEKPWKCQYCDKQFLHKDTYVTHERRHTGEKPFVCQFCPRAFAEQWSLKKHTRLHTGEKPYKCKHCGKTFADCSNLTKHKRVHGLTANSTQFDPINGSEIDNEGLKIYVIKQDSQDRTSFSNDDKQLNDINVGEELSGQWTTLSDDNEITVTLPDGRTFQIVSIDMDTNEVQIRISGATFQIQLAEPPDIDQIREVVLRMKLPLVTNDSKLVDFDDVSSLNFINKIHHNGENCEIIGNEDVGVELAEVSEQRFQENSEDHVATFSSALDAKSFSSEFQMETLKNIYLVE